MKKILGSLLAKLFPEKWKTYSELSFWKNKQHQEGTLHNDHYRFFYTTHFGLDDRFYSSKRILDIGCGPRGSLEWATMSERRVGLDPLAKRYLKLGANNHQMEYSSYPSENIPFDDAYFDVVCAFNSLDHVTSVEESIAEIKRVVKPGGLFLLLVEINHAPTNCEPHKITPDIIQRFSPEFECIALKAYKPIETGLYDSIKGKNEFAEPQQVQKAGWLSAKFQRL